MTVTELITGQPAWAPQIAELLAVHGPAKPAAVAKRLHAAGHKVTAAEVEEELASRLDVHETENGWLSLRALAEGSVLTTVLTEQEHRTGMLDPCGDLDLWERLADDGIPLASGGELRLRWDGGLPGLAGPDGWLDEFEPGSAIGLRLHGGKAEVVTAGEAVSGLAGAGAFADGLADRVAPLLTACMTRCRESLAEYAMVAEESPSDLDETMPGALLSDVVADLLAAEPTALSDPLPPIALLLTAAGFEVSGGLVGLAGTFWNPGEAEQLDPAEIVASVLASTLLRAGGQGADAAEMCPQFWTLVSSGPDVVARVADTVERSGALPEVLDELRASAAEPGQLAVAALLASRAAEADGDAEGAYRLAQEAVSLDPALEPALADAGENAAARGDYAAADAFLRRAGWAADEDLRRTLLRLLRPLAAEPGGVSRNKPCPCGSGKKYKACCLASAPRPLRDRAVARHASIEAYTERAPGLDLVYAYQAACDSTELWSLAVDLAAFDGGLALEYLESRGQWLPADELALVKQWLDTPLAVYEVTEVRPGSGALVRPMPDGDPVWLADPSLSAEVRRLDLFLARLLDCGGIPALLSFPARVDRGRRQALLRLLSGDGRGDAEPGGAGLRDAGPGRAGQLDAGPDGAGVSEAGLTGAGLSRAVHRAYDPAEVMAFFGPQPLPALQNREGHELVQCSAIYDVSAVSGGAAGAADAWSRLGNALAGEAGEAGEGDEEDRVNAHIEMDGELLLRGSVQRDGARWTIECDSIERLRDLQLIVTGAAPGARLVSESTIPMDMVLAERMAAADSEADGPAWPGIPAPRDIPAPRGIPGPRAAPDAGTAGAGHFDPARFLDQYLRDAERRWVDDSIPALGGRTPRQAVAEGGAALGELLALLDDFEWKEQGTRGGGLGMSSAHLKDLLGLERTR